MPVCMTASFLFRACVHDQLFTLARVSTRSKGWLTKQRSMTMIGFSLKVTLDVYHLCDSACVEPRFVSKVVRDPFFPAFSDQCQTAQYSREALPASPPPLSLCRSSSTVFPLPFFPLPFPLCGSSSTASALFLGRDCHRTTKSRGT